MSQRFVLEGLGQSLLISAWSRPVWVMAMVPLMARIMRAIRLLQSVDVREGVSLMFAGCMVRSAAVGVAALIVLTLKDIAL